MAKQPGREALATVRESRGRTKFRNSTKGEAPEYVPPDRPAVPVIGDDDDHSIFTSDDSVYAYTAED